MKENSSCEYAYLQNVRSINVKMKSNSNISCIRNKCELKYNYKIDNNNYRKQG